jgi:magnesium transporter
MSRVRGSQLGFLTEVTKFYRARSDTKVTIAAKRLAVIVVLTLPVTALSSVFGMDAIVKVAVTERFGCILALRSGIRRWRRE